METCQYIRFVTIGISAVYECISILVLGSLHACALISQVPVKEPQHNFIEADAGEVSVISNASGRLQSNGG